MHCTYSCGAAERRRIIRFQRRAIPPPPLLFFALFSLLYCMRRHANELHSLAFANFIGRRRRELATRAFSKRQKSGNLSSEFVRPSAVRLIWTYRSTETCWINLSGTGLWRRSLTLMLWSQPTWKPSFAWESGQWQTTFEWVRTVWAKCLKQHDFVRNH
jgi:hypothetical protein